MSFELYDGYQKPKRRVKKIFIHCSASDHAHHANPETIDRWHKKRWGKNSGIGYHFFIDFEGQVHEGRPLYRTPAAQRGYNRGSIAICLAGGQNSKDVAFTESQFESLRGLCTDIDEAYEGRVTFHGHREVAAKACPVFDYKTVLGLDAKGHLKRGVPTEKKLLVAESRTVKTVRKNDDIGFSTGVIGVIGGASQVIKPDADAETISRVTETASKWRTALDTATELISWGVAHWWLLAIAVGALLVYRNRQIIRARIEDEIKVGRLAND